MNDSTNTSNAAPVAVAAPRLQAMRQRLDRLDGFLREDPANQTLLVDAFETALACGEWERAHFHLRHGQSLQVDALAWRLREGDFFLAQQRYDEAVATLAALAGTPGAPDGFAHVLLHNQAFVDFRRYRFGDCIARLEEVLAGPQSLSLNRAPVQTVRALQQLWLRALHQHAQRARGVAWAQEAEQHNRLDVHAGGVASLLAFDVEDFANARRWAQASLAAGEDAPVEALVTEGSAALAAGDPQQAVQVIDHALQAYPGEGRAWSVRGFAQLYLGSIDQAEAAFDRAVELMPRHIGTWHGLGWTQMQRGDLGAARRSFETALALDRNFSDTHGGLAVVLALEGARPEAEVHVELALRLDRRSLSGLYAQALLDGRVTDQGELRRLAKRLFGDRPAPYGGRVVDLLPSLGDGEPGGVPKAR
ncbi:tetratricopeptide repeat protein [Variovorax arabinosiphilus]|uniref:tetratricopeptide repeat protein n=1 Tax=Variovorax arabinosiphilus TaxID=3053498 RepID=UPI0025759B85|nr:MULTISPECIES: tetratricopeptide repeat protein [unclassified Variovorax]MDM0122203.1 tetratricopeptide repeat protein [Variovorax sp. J2L1-78]MDM0131268.1 tetratricopeptide repeat protein [Variovorax sp. J2L1-63]MDM0234966.1 tetratricopeptide repeat protein [Variovorax sp. J2R1-6]